MPEVQVSGVEDLQAFEIHQEADAQVRGIEGGDLHIVAEADDIPRSHTAAAGADRHIRGNDILDPGHVLPGEDNGIHMVRMVMADKYVDLFIRPEGLRRDAVLLRELFPLAQPVIEDQHGILARNGKTAVVVVRNEITQQDNSVLSPVIVL